MNKLLYRRIYDELKDQAETIIPGALQFPDLDLPDPDSMTLYNNIIWISLFISILSVVNLAMEMADALSYYTRLDESGQTSSSGELLTDKGVYDWDHEYKPVAGIPQIEEHHTYGNAKLSEDKHSLEANTPYTKDVVNAALALELFVDGEYLNADPVLNPSSGTKKTFEFIATRYYDDGGTTDGAKGVGRIENKETDYANDRLGIIMLSADNNSLTISKEVTNTKEDEDLDREWKFNITITTKESEWFTTHDKLEYTLYKRGTGGDWDTGTVGSVTFEKTPEGSSEMYTLTATLLLKHDQKAVFKDLPDGTWQVKEESPTDDPLYTPHNNANSYSEEEWMYRDSNETSVNTLDPISQVDLINEFPYELPSAGGKDIDRYIFFGTAGTVASVLLAAMLWHDRRKRRARQA